MPADEALNESNQIERQTIKGKLDESNLYQIKLPSVLKRLYSEIFEELDRPEVQQDMNIDTYNVRVTSLEEVFNSLGEEEMAKYSSETLSANMLDADEK